MFNLDWIKKLFRDNTPKTVPDYEFRPLSFSMFATDVWAVGGGKGGVGKSLLASNLGIALSKRGKKVLLIDADLGAANLHTFLGVEGGRAAFSSFLKEEISDIRSLIIKTPVPNLDLISGAKDSLDVADVGVEKIARLKNSLRRVEYDNVILDIGPGTASTLLDLFLMSNEGIIMATPEPTTIENNYRFLKCLFLRKIRLLADSQQDGRLKEILMKIFSDKWSVRVRTVADILDQLYSLDPQQGRTLREYISDTRISMVMNQTRDEAEARIGPSIKQACSDYFGVDIRLLGTVAYDSSVGDSIRTRKPLLVHYSGSPAAASIEACARSLTDKNPQTAGMANTY
ncbi:MAG: AAA family ATPase [Deltaproteobacteria bacterium]|nr:AAA family ATPase [Deltaproteobacteria bacterium]